MQTMNDVLIESLELVLIHLVAAKDDENARKIREIIESLKNGKP